MKNIILIAIILLGFACKKKTVTPTEPVTPPCIISPDQFSGKYVSVHGDTIQIIYLHDNCPVNKSNTYLVKKLGEAVQFVIKSNENFDKKDYEIIVDGNTNFGNYSNQFNLNRESSGSLIFSSYKAHYSIEFTKI